MELSELNGVMRGSVFGMVLFTQGPLSPMACESPVHWVSAPAPGVLSSR